MISALKPLSMFYRLSLTFGMGFLCCYFLSLNLTLWFSTFLPKAESVFLAGFSAIIFYTAFVIFAFSSQHIKRFSAFSFALFFALFFSYRYIG